MPRRSPQAGASVPKAGPERYELDLEPSWIAALRQELRDISDTQRHMSTQLQDSGQELRQLREGSSTWVMARKP